MVVDTLAPADRLWTLKGTHSYSRCSVTNTCASFSATPRENEVVTGIFGRIPAKLAFPCTLPIGASVERTLVAFPRPGKNLFRKVKTMKTSPRWSLSFAAKRSFVVCAIALLLAWALHSNVLAAPPVVDIYQDMEAGNAGDVLTAALCTASSHGAGSWTIVGADASLWVSTRYARNLPGPVIVGGVTYNGAGGTRTWEFAYNHSHNYPQVHISYNTPGLTTACYYTPAYGTQLYSQIDSIGMEGYGGWCCLQTYYNSDGTDSVRSHSQNPTGASTYGPWITVQIGKTYWVNTRLDRAGSASIAVFDPDNAFAQVGSVSWCDARPDSRSIEIGWGRYDGTGERTVTALGHFDNILVDYTNGLYPLLPNVTDTTAPSAPPAVRDGTGADISTTNSTTQLSANWDAGSDAESGIFGYRYAIGTTPGGTNAMDWIYVGNVTSVTQSFLSLTVGQTYYFSVKSVNRAGLLSAATNSNGQTVVSGTDTTPPSAPPAVRDGTGSDISTTSSTTQLSANWDASSDAESGISGYQYAVGTTAGGAQTVNWTSLGNVTTVTKTGLTLTNGQTYYFSVRAVNGAGLTGAATNSNGQTVAAGASVVYFQDNFESWTAHGGAWSSVTGETSTHTLNTTASYAKAGAKGLKLADTDTTAVYGACLIKNFSPAISTDVYVRFYVFFPTGFGTANAGCDRRVLRVWTGTSRSQISFLNGAPIMEEVGNWGAVTGAAVSENQWHCIEMHMAAPSAGTLMELWVDGVKNSATLNGAFGGGATWDYMELGDVVLGGSTNATGTFYMDEVVVSNSYVGTGITAPVTYFQDAFDSWSVHGGAWSSVNGESSAHTLNTSTDYARAGTKSLKLTDTDTTGSTGAYLTKTFSPAISGGVYVRFYVFYPTGYWAGNVDDARRVLRIYCGSNRGQLSFRNAAPIMEEIGAWGSITGAAMSENAWHCIEMHITAPAAATVLEYWVDGVLNNAALTANFSASSAFDHVDLGDVALASGQGNGTFYIDEAVVSDSYVGPLP
jgi:hypothetical protein